jgi:hypothetical protein
MTLERALEQIERLMDDDVVFARKPWIFASQTTIGKLDCELRVPQKIADRGFEYFLEVNLRRR